MIQIKEVPEKYCEYCGKRLYRKRINGRLEDRGVFCRRKYCNRECMKRAFVKKDGSTQKDREAHASARKIEYLILDKDKVCEVCGSTKNIDVHHKDGNWQNNHPSNLVTLCRSCHSKQHKQKRTCKLCGEPVKGHGYCNMHYIRWKKYGDPMFCRGSKVSPTHSDRF